MRAFDANNIGMRQAFVGIQLSLELWQLSCEVGTDRVQNVRRGMTLDMQTLKIKLNTTMLAAIDVSISIAGRAWEILIHDVE